MTMPHAIETPRLLLRQWRATDFPAFAAMSDDAQALPEIVAFTARTNRRSLALMARLGMREAGGFPHPALPAGHPRHFHRLFRLTASIWRASRASFSTPVQSKVFV